MNIVKHSKMNAFIVVVVALAVSAPSLAQDDGRYRPELYGDDGSYRPSGEGRYQGGAGGGFRAASTSFNTYNDYQTYRGSAQPIRTIQPAVVAQPTFVQPIGVPAPARVQQGVSGRYADAYATALRDVKDIDVNSYRYLYELSNNIAAEEAGNIASDVSGTEARGFYEYVGDDGVKYRVDYTAGADGFRPVGAHIPV